MRQANLASHGRKRGDQCGVFRGWQEARLQQRAQNIMKRAAIYARVSTRNNGQNPETQLLALREYVRNHGWDLSHEYIDNGISGSKDSRPELDKLMRDSRARKLDAIIVA